VFEGIYLRPRSHAEATDLGFAISREHFRALLGVALLIMLPIGFLAAMASSIAPPAGIILAWWFKPLLDKPLLHLMSRRVAGMNIGIGQTLRDWRQWWFGGQLALLTVYRLHPERAAVLPIWQLEGLRGGARRNRCRALSHGNAGSGTVLMLAASSIEIIILITLLVLAIWAAPTGLEPEIPNIEMMQLAMLPAELWYWLLAAYLFSIVLVEPFYQGAGFGQYLNQRCRLECWDLEPAFRQLAARAGGAS
jgi:GNAT superfamily N-acetyltransferase